MSRKMSARSVKKLNPLGLLWKGAVFLWEHPLIITVVLLLLVGYFFPVLIKDTFGDIMKCDYLVTQKMNVPPAICDGFSLKVADIPGSIAIAFNQPGWESLIRSGLNMILGDQIKGSIDLLPPLEAAIDPSLEIVRQVMVWGAVALFALLSFFVTFVLSKLRSVVKLILLSRDEWRNLLFGLRTWAFIFLLMIGAFYYWANIYLMQSR